MVHLDIYLSELLFILNTVWNENAGPFFFNVALIHIRLHHKRQ